MQTTQQLKKEGMSHPSIRAIPYRLLSSCLIAIVHPVVRQNLSSFRYQKLLHYSQDLKTDTDEATIVAGDSAETAFLVLDSSRVGDFNPPCIPSDGGF